MFRVIEATSEDFSSLCVDDLEGSSEVVFLNDCEFYKITDGESDILCLGFEEDDFGVYVRMTVSPKIKHHLKEVIGLCKDVIKHFPKKTYCVIEKNREDLARFARFFGYCIDKTQGEVLLYNKRYNIYIRE